jgi:NDP-sugar pyrophosphorylase family protein
LGTAGALRFAVERFQSDAVLVLNGDSYCDVDLKEFCRWHRQREANASIVLTKVDNSDRFGSVHTNPDGMITRFGEKVALQTGGWINAGIYLLARRLIEQIPAQRPVSLEREVFPEWIGRGFYGYQHLGLFLDIGTPESFAGAAQLLAAKEST